MMSVDCRNGRDVVHCQWKIIPVRMKLMYSGGGTVVVFTSLLLHKKSVMSHQHLSVHTFVLARNCTSFCDFKKPIVTWTCLSKHTPATRKSVNFRNYCLFVAISIIRFIRLWERINTHHWSVLVSLLSLEWDKHSWKHSILHRTL